MLSEDEKYLLRKRLVAQAGIIKKKAKGGKDYCCDLSAAKVLDIRLKGACSGNYTEIENTRIHEGIFE